MRKSRRTEAFTAIATLQQAQERWRGNHATYSEDLGELGITSATTTPGGYYTLSVDTETASAPTEYTATAVAVSTKSQAKDRHCARLAVKVSGGHISYGSCESCGTFTFAESDVCWSR
jgi:type IV pilus assembly protein PilE